VNTNPSWPRRSFLRAAVAGGAWVGLGDLAFFGRLPPVAAAETRPEPARVQFRPEIEPLVRLIEDTPRERLLERVAERVHGGTPYRDVLTALLLAGVRNIQPRPVGFKFHAVLVVNSAHLASQNAPATDRWLPLFWALDYFKSSQARGRQEGGWNLSAVDERAVPAADRARAAFTEALDRWDEAKTDAAVAGWVRTAGAHDLFDTFCRYGARDFRDIGHKAIYVANSWRTLQNIGWQHAEPVLRSLAYALLEHEGGNPADRDAEPDRPGRRHAQLLHDIRPTWPAGQPDAAGTAELLATLRMGTWEQAGEKVAELLNRGVAAPSLWDACFAHAAELLMRRPGIITLHACTTTNALHYAFTQAARDETRLFLLLQNAAFLPLFRARAGAGGEEGLTLDRLEPVGEGKADTGAVSAIFETLSRDRLAAASQALGWLEAGGDVRSFLAAAQRLIYLKGRDSHDYKFSSAVFEDYAHLSPAWRDRFLAASVYWLKGAGAPDNALVARTRALL
jgi:hypothetical protein